MVPDWIMEVIDFLAYHLVCRAWGHRPGAWHPTHADTQGRLCDRCLRSQRRVLGVNGPWERIS